VKRVLLQRLALLPILLIGVSLIAFTLVHLTPGDPARELAGGPSATPRQIAQVKQDYGLDESLPVQYLKYVENVAQGNFGTSLKFNTSVNELIGDRLPATIELVGAALLVGIPGGLLLGIFAARHRDSLADHATTLLSVAGLSLPLFWLAFLFAWLVSVQLGLLPLGGRLPPFTELERVTGLNTVDALLAGQWSTFGEALRYLLLPALTLAIIPLALISRFTRASFVEVLEQDYIRTARAYGVTERKIIWQHAAKNALLPLITLFGILVPAMLVASVLSEAVFTWQGFGNLLLEAMRGRDYAVVQSIVLILGVICVVANALVDISYALLDPRTRRSA
jgi:ABC-type dipeptide/oligopeptide/nickel transport system permease component